jgi:magnesium chelatase family protein
MFNFKNQYEKLSGDRMAETSESIRARVQATRNIQLTCFANIESSNIAANADMRVGEIRHFCKLQDEGQSLIRAAMSQLNLSARAYHRILQLARTIADLAGCEDILSVHLAEALQYRPKIMMGKYCPLGLSHLSNLISILTHSTQIC